MNIFINKASSDLFNFFPALPFGGAADVLSTMDPDLDEEDEETPVYAKKDAQLYGQEAQKKQKFVSMAFMKKYIHLAKAIRVGA